MDASFSTQLFSGQVVQAICWTLIHSLWIGLLTAVVTGGVMMATQKSAPQVRYQLMSSTLLGFVLTMAVVLYWELTTFNPQQPTGNLLVESVGPVQAAVYQNSVVEDFDLYGSLIAFVNRESGWIFLIWLAFFVVKSLKLAGGIYYAHRIRYRRVLAVEPHWQTRLESFRQVLGISQSVRLLQSALVSVPVTVGLFKPVILVPVGLFFQLSPEQIETILWHELAHIWRRDYLVNIGQCLVETVFFFNPGLLWLSSLIRNEREACCDDIVLAHSLGKRHYVEALLAFQLNTHTDSALVMGLGSHKLVNRLKRLVTEENKRLSLVEKIALLLGLLGFSAFSMLPPSPEEARLRRVASAKPAFFGVDQHTQTKNKAAAPVLRSPDKRLPPPVDTVPASPATPTQSAPVRRQFTSILFVTTNQEMANREMTVREATGIRYHLTIANNQLVALTINDTPVAASDLNQYQDLLRQIDQALLAKKQAKHDTLARSMAMAEAKRQQQRLWQKEAQLRKFDKRQPSDQPEKLYRKEVADQASKKEFQRDINQPEPAYSTVKKKWKETAKADTAANMRSWKTKRMPEPSDLAYDQQRQRVRGVIAALVQQGVVADPSAVDGFGLSDSELIVNGVRQSAELHQKLKAQYGVKPDYGLIYGSGTGKGIVVEKSEL
ncbi:M56 family metallopeptidase [Fibrella arboris]|uniref:M56 family metallopeptidase n=1 Tax=Fibrella arboris TaxID=3242486 RepID=UPI00352255B8